MLTCCFSTATTIQTPANAAAARARPTGAPRTPLAPPGHREGRQREDRELAMKDAEARQRAEGRRPVSQRPQAQDVQERFDAGAEGEHQLHRNKRGCGHEGQRGGQREHGADSPAGHLADQQHGDSDVDEEQGRAQHRERRPADPEERRGHPRLHGQHVVLAVEEQRERPELAQVLRHEANNGLIGIEHLLEAQRNSRAQQHDSRGDARAEHQLTAEAAAAARGWRGPGFRSGRRRCASRPVWSSGCHLSEDLLAVVRRLWPFG